MASRGAGSPAQRYGLPTNVLIVAVDGRPISGLGDFLQAVAKRADREEVLLHLRTASGARRALSLRLDMHYWPTWLLRAEKGTWRPEPLMVATSQ